MNAQLQNGVQVNRILILSVRGVGYRVEEW